MKKVLLLTIASLVLLFTAPLAAFAAVHTVSTGESLFLIGQRYNISLDELKNANGLVSNSIYPGQKLWIPDRYTKIHTVSAGETLFQVSQWYGTSVAAIKAANGLKSDTIMPGQKLVIPAKQSVPSANAPASAKAVYRVQSGDTLYLIARSYGTTVAEIKRINNLYSDTVYPGQVLSISGQAAAAPSRASFARGISRSDIDLLAHLVYGEARGESFEGQVAVAAVALNRLKSPDFPNTIRDVIFEPWAFTAVNDGQFYLTPNSTAYQAVDQALNGWDPTGGALYYWNPVTATNQWVWSRPVIKTIGKHVFAV